MHKCEGGRSHSPSRLRLEPPVVVVVLLLLTVVVLLTPTVTKQMHAASESEASESTHQPMGSILHVVLERKHIIHTHTNRMWRGATSTHPMAYMGMPVAIPVAAVVIVVTVVPQVAVAARTRARTHTGTSTGTGTGGGVLRCWRPAYTPRESP
jgi:uncharacterized membrane protein YeiB